MNIRSCVPAIYGNSGNVAFWPVFTVRGNTRVCLFPYHERQVIAQIDDIFVALNELNAHNGPGEH